MIQSTTGYVQDRFYAGLLSCVWIWRCGGWLCAAGSYGGGDEPGGGGGAEKDTGQGSEKESREVGRHGVEGVSGTQINVFANAVSKAHWMSSRGRSIKQMQLLATCIHFERRAPTTSKCNILILTKALSTSSSYSVELLS